MTLKHIIIVTSIFLGLWHSFKLVSSSAEIHLTYGKSYFSNDTKFIDLSKIRVKKINRTHHVVDGELELFRNIGDEYDVEIIVYQKIKSEYKKTSYKIGPKKFCQFFREEKKVYPDMQDKTDLPSIDTCPWPKSTYHFNSYILKIEKIPSIFSDGEYMVQWTIMRDGKILNGYMVYANLVNSKFMQK